jgi:hypothetical protein
LLSNQLIRGGDLNNAIVFVNRAVSQEELNRLAKLFKKPSVRVSNTRARLSQEISTNPVVTTAKLYPVSEGLFQGVARSKIIESAQRTKIKAEASMASNTFNINEIDIRKIKTRIPKQYESLSNIQIKSVGDKYSFSNIIIAFF